MIIKLTSLPLYKGLAPFPPIGTHICTTRPPTHIASYHCIPELDFPLFRLTVGLFLGTKHQGSFYYMTLSIYQENCQAITELRTLWSLCWLQSHGHHVPVCRCLWNNAQSMQNSRMQDQGWLTGQWWEIQGGGGVGQALPLGTPVTTILALWANEKLFAQTSPSPSDLSNEQLKLPNVCNLNL